MKTLQVRNVPNGANVLVAYKRAVYLTAGVYINREATSILSEDIVDKFIHRSTQYLSTLYFNLEDDMLVRIRKSGWKPFSRHSDDMKLSDHYLATMELDNRWTHSFDNNEFRNQVFMGIDPINYGIDLARAGDCDLHGTITITHPAALITPTNIC